MKFRFALAALATAAMGLALAQTPAPQPAPAAPAVVEIPPAPKPVGTAWVLMDYTTGQVLAGENHDERVELTSITKVMTSYVLAAEIKNGKISETDDVMLSERAWREGGARTDGSYSGFAVNQTAKLLDMEKGMAVQSGNDAAIALAEHTMRQPGGLRRADEQLCRADRHEELALRQRARPVGAGSLLDRLRPGAARPRADPRLPGGVFLQQDQGIHRRHHHPAQPQPAAVARSVGRRHQDRPPFRRRLTA